MNHAGIASGGPDNGVRVEVEVCMVHGWQCSNVHLQLQGPIGWGRGRLPEGRRSAKVTIRHRHGRYFGQGSLHSECTR